MIEITNKSKCSGCAACVSSCPMQCIKMVENSEGFFYPEIDNEKCVGCGKCKSVCPVNKSRSAKEPAEVWAMFAENKDTRFTGSSGGVFSLLAEIVISEGGCVYGAAFSDDYTKVKHVRADSVSGLEKMKTSKYLQSNTDGIYTDVLTQLKSDRKVLYSGTPCQIAGLKAFLGDKKYDNLMCVEVVCHGVPSPKLWEKYILWISSEHACKVTHVNFRYKIPEEKKWVKDVNSGSIVYCSKMSSDPYFYMFLKNFCLRESCYQCSAKNSMSGADLTIGDFWGIDEINPGLDGKKGVSLVLVNSEKGSKIVEMISPKAFRQQVGFHQAIRKNTAYYNSVVKPRVRDSFFKGFDEMSWMMLEKKYGRETIREKIRKQLGRVYRALKTRSTKPLRGNDIYSLFVRLDR